MFNRNTLNVPIAPNKQDSFFLSADFIEQIQWVFSYLREFLIKIKTSKTI
jgi:hypothetical protein